MKLDHLLVPAFAVAVLAFAGGCSSGVQAGGARARTAGAQPVSDAVAITQLMSAQLPGPVPKVGKSHLAVGEDDIDLGATSSDATITGDATDSEPAKTSRRSDGSRRHGGFGTTK